MTTATLDERPSRTTKELLPAVHAALRGSGMSQRGSRGSHQTLFAVPFRSPMGECDSRRLAAGAGLDCDLHPKLPGGTVSPGLRRLDFASGLFLIRGAGDGEWRLEGRSWDAPAPGVVHRWHVLAATAARVLDSDVPVPAPTMSLQGRRVS